MPATVELRQVPRVNYLRPLKSQNRGESARRSLGFQHRLYGALDLGTHNCRMLVARPDPTESFRVVHSFSRPVRLGEGLSDRELLSEAAMDRALTALGLCAERMRRAGVLRARTIATEACRRAENAGLFITRVREETGLEVEAVSPRDEARLTLSGCVPLLDSRFRNILLFDIGGGSTEVSWVEQTPFGRLTIIDTISIPDGVVSLAERYGGDVISRYRYQEMVEAAFEQFAAFEQKYAIARAIEAGLVQMIGTSGTVTTLAAAYLNLTRYNRARVDGLRLDFDDVALVSARLAATSWRDRASNPCIGPERADLVVAGCALLDAVCKRWPVGRITVADRGIREGLLISMMAEDNPKLRRRIRHAAGG